MIKLKKPVAILSHSDKVFRIDLDLLDHISKVRRAISRKLSRRSVLEHLTSLQHQNTITANNRVNAMSNSHNCCVLELILNQSLHFLFCEHIDGGSGLVQDYDLVVAQDSPAQTDQLSLAS